ncbi:hypothetical protein Taro_020945, partial [Colocasia esculenta]|nr:hypothetical protein [Colocasia esculenta]
MKIIKSGSTDWVTFRQGVECGFQGRTNKLVDGCYSFWQGGVLALVQRILSIVDKQVKSSIHEHGKETVESTCSTSSSHFSGGESDVDEHPCEAVETYSKNMEGQLSDIGFHFLKRESGWGPLFHSIALQQYILLCCQVLDGGFRDKPGKHRDHYHSCYCLSGLALCQYSWTKDANIPPTTTVLGPYSNLLEPIHPLYGVVLDKYYE